MLIAKSAASAIVRHRRVAFCAWALVVATLLPLSTGVEKRLETGSRVAGSESERVATLMATRFASPYARYAVLVVNGLRDPADSVGVTVVERIVATLDSNTAVARTFSLLDLSDSLFVGRNGGTFVIVGLQPSDDGFDAALASLRRSTSRLLRELRVAQPDIELLWTGEHALTADLRRVSADDAARAERRVLPLTLLVLVIAFGAIAAALLPIGLGALAIVVTLGLLALIARALTTSILVLNVATMLGLGLGIDYALLLVSRFREARRRGLSPEEAAIESTSHAGRSVVLSGAAVLVGFLALLVVPLTDIRSIAVGGALVTVISVLLATTLMPGVLASLGDRIEWGRVALSFRSQARDDTPAWQRWSRAVVRRPLLVLCAAGVPVALLAWQWTALETHTPDGDWLPSSAESARGLRTLRGMGRSGVVYGIRVLVELPPEIGATSLRGWGAVARLTMVLEQHPGVARVRSLPRTPAAGPSKLAVLPPCAVPRMPECMPT